MEGQYLNRKAEDAVLTYNGIKLIDTFIGPSKPFKLPRRNLVMTAIQKLMLRPKRVLKTTLKPNQSKKYKVVFFEMNETYKKTFL